MMNLFELCSISETESQFCAYDNKRQPQGYITLAWDGENLHIAVANKDEKKIADMQQPIDFNGKENA